MLEFWWSKHIYSACPSCKLCFWAFSPGYQALKGQACMRSLSWALEYVLHFHFHHRGVCLEGAACQGNRCCWYLQRWTLAQSQRLRWRWAPALSSMQCLCALRTWARVGHVLWISQSGLGLSFPKAVRLSRMCWMWKPSQGGCPRAQVTVSLWDGSHAFLLWPSMRINVIAVWNMGLES